MNATLETSTLQFKTLMGNADLAQAHVAMLFHIAKETPFETGPIIAASQSLESFGGAALNTQKNIMMIGDAAAATGSPIQELGFWVGRLYSSLAAGKPFGEAAQRLQELKVLTPEARMAMEKLQETGGSTAAAWDILTTSFGKFEGGMKEQAGTWQGLVSTFTDGAHMLIGAAFKPVFEGAKEALSGINDFVDVNGDEWSAAMVTSVKDVIDALGGVPDSADPVGEFLTAIPGWIHDTAQPLKDFKGFVDDIRKSVKEMSDAKDEVAAFFKQFDIDPDRYKVPTGGGAAPRLGPNKPTHADIVLGVEGAAAARAAAIAAQQADAEAALGASQSAAEGKRLSAQAARTDAATALANARGAGNGLTGNFGSDEAALAKAAAKAKAAQAEAERQYREAERAAKEYHQTKAITSDLFSGALVRGTDSAALGEGRAAFAAMRQVIEEGGQANIDAVGKMAADMAQRMRTSGMDPAEAEDWVRDFMGAIDVAVVTQSVEVAKHVGEVVKAFDIERQLQDQGRKSVEAINIATDLTATAINDAQTSAVEAVGKLREEFDFSASVKSDMDKLNAAVRTGMRAMTDQIAEAGRRLAGEREMLDIGTGIGRDTAGTARARSRENLSTTIGIQRAREDLAEAHNRRLAEINKAGGPGAPAARAAEAQAFAQQSQQMAKQESRAAADRLRARTDQDADRALALQLAAEDRALRDARAASDREQQTLNERMLTVEQARLELPLRQLESGVAIRGLNQQIAAAYQTQEDTIRRANEALAERIRLAERERDLLRERLGLMGSSGGSAISGGGTAPAGFGFGGITVPVTIQNDGFIGAEDIAQEVEGAIIDRVMALGRASG